eukprot:CAMPEP_0172680612 /NCGR_PEP_ID=MMETSP1074-20121228/16880_1 /TAXON_ID=2916 /ORGANISM="Ceratium fusus, Strain PA161109" /LENGTH=432 /DNA_ID=CAMNT_0013498969 /DNA_START=53 /DNA_END=1351 /DNA_ORIENTATION=+
MGQPASGFAEPAPPPRWLHKIRSAQAVDQGPSSLEPIHMLGGSAAGASIGLTYVHCVFSSPLSPAGPCVVVGAGLVDTGSSDCELRGNLLARLPVLPVVMRGAIYETATGGEAFDAYEVLVTIHGRTAAVVVTACDSGSSDDALIGHMALGALGLEVHCPARRLLPPSCSHEAVDERTSPGQSADGAHDALGPRQGNLHAEGPVQTAFKRPSFFGRCFGQTPYQTPAVGARGHAEEEEEEEEEEEGVKLSSRPPSLAPRWIRCNSCAIAISGLSPGADPSISEIALPDGLAKEVIPVTYVQCRFTSPLAPTAASVTVAAALVDTGSADCELREGLLRRLGPLPIVARGIVYETVSGRAVHDGYEVLITVNGRSCAAVATVTPEERFAADAEDPNSDEAVIGFAALAALGLIVDCQARRVRHCTPLSGLDGQR